MQEYKSIMSVRGADRKKSVPRIMQVKCLCLININVLEEKY